MSVTFHLSTPEVQTQSIEELKQQKNYMKLLKKHGKELKELRKKHLKKVRGALGRRESRRESWKIRAFCFQVWNLSKEQKSRSNQITSDSQRRRSQMEKSLKRSIKKK